MVAEPEAETKVGPELSFRSLLLRWLVFPMIAFAMFVLYFNSSASTFRPPEQKALDQLTTQKKNPWALDKPAQPAR